MKSIVSLLALTILVSAGCRNKPIKETFQELSRVRVTQVFPETLSIPVLSTGVLVSSEEIKLSFKTGGIVAKIPVKEGDRVDKGDILATLNPSEINAQVNLATESYDKAVRDFTRAKNLYTDSVATLEQMQNAATALNAAKLTLDIAKFNQMHSEIQAPQNGVILKQFVNTNELIASGYPVFLFGSTGKYWKVKTGISDRDIVKINPGDSAIITFDAWQGSKFPAIVDQVGAMANPLSGTYEVEMILRETDFRLATGFIAGVVIFPSKKETLIMIPIGAVVEAEGKSGYVFFVNDSLKAQKIKIEIVAIKGSKVAIKGKLNGITEIVTEGAAYLRDDEKVKIVR